MDGILPVYKEAGMTSHDVVFKLRKILHMKKIGHAGTLDPSVDGVLPVALGKATKTIEFLQESGKIYTGEVTFGFATTTEDLDGEVVESQPLSRPFTTDEIAVAMKALTGDITQIPPMFSAVKVNGRRLYEYARAGETVERPERQATIYRFERTFEPIFDETTGTQKFTFIAEVSKGTYIRTLAVDLGKQLGVPAVMSQLTRQKAGGYDLSQAHSLADIAEMMTTNGNVDVWLQPLDSAVSQYPHVALTDEQWAKVKNGIGLPKTALIPVADKIVITYQGDVKSVFEWREDRNQYRPYRTFSIE
ncbi:tRNA pseudouridine(55) synthase TruB [Weissella cibaria]|uniref:tRNA pseudouridine synthase B n=1 Tax=Weissella cibaria TaxID=137591 RepID=A0A9Q8JJQ3_9LACO|nr:tRNA pseudouridine(55) synthase TruB [Weissella cibaria]QDG80168.1 tRNA pseudouridine(55) synthase TruB [Weissella cibaria]TVV27563.1 tRNA pseudouridine(55) synthase TruB [Weissella cibaria]TVV35995.1 tRNA pseudouridine(55) synthase TruB [Weissella cibaria]TVV40755.1 tRNA pseudouridine(55) synthase TruB [Weissella cibaria]UNW39898.1 tRNA pseudouridine(55) synthase TruB [Weissella cibaria]